MSHPVASGSQRAHRRWMWAHQLHNNDDASCCFSLFLSLFLLSFLLFLFLSLSLSLVLGCPSNSSTPCSCLFLLVAQLAICSSLVSSNPIADSPSTAVPSRKKKDKTQEDTRATAQGTAPKEQERKTFPSFFLLQIFRFFLFLSPLVYAVDTLSSFPPSYAHARLPAPLKTTPPHGCRSPFHPHACHPPALASAAPVAGPVDSHSSRSRFLHSTARKKFVHSTPSVIADSTLNIHCLAMTFASSSSVSSSAASSPAEDSATPPNALSMSLPVSGPIAPETDSSRFEPSQGLAHPLMATAHMQPLHPLHPLQANQGFVEPEARSLANFAGLAILTPPDQHQEQDPEAQYDIGQQEASNRYNLPSFPQGESRTDHFPASAFPSPGSFQPYAPSSDGPIIHHRNSIAGSTLPNPVVRARRAGSMAMVEDGPFFSNTKQFHRVFNMNQTQQYKLRVMARIDRGFFTANRIWTCYRRNYFQVSTAFSILGFDHSQLSEVPCLIELSDSESHIQTDPSFQRDPNNVTNSLDNLHLNERSRLAVVTNFSICITSKIASTDKKIDLIQHTPKRDKGPQIVPGLRPIRGGGTLTLAGASTNQNVVTFERVQFKTATANNGKRRAAQQFYILMVDLYAHTDDGQVFCVASSQSDSLVVRGRSPGHYIDTPERDLVTSPGLETTRERRLSSISQHSSPHPYHSHYPGPHSRSHSISAGAGISVDVSSLGLTSNGSPLSPMSPGAAGEYSPSVGAPHALYSYPTHHAWTDGSSMSSPASTYDGSAFSSPTTAYPNFQHYQGQHSPQEQAHQSYFAQRQPSFGSITPRLMMGSTGPSPGHPFDNRLEPPMEQSHESDDGSTMYYPSYENSPSGMHMKSGEYTQQHAPSSHPLGHGDVTSPLNGHPFIKTEAQEEYFPYSAPFVHPAGHAVVETGIASGLGPTPSSTTASSVSSSFGYPVQEMGGMDLQQQQAALPENGSYESTLNTHAYRPVVSIAQYPQEPHPHEHQHQHQHQHPIAAMQHEQDRRKAMAWS